MFIPLITLVAAWWSDRQDAAPAAPASPERVGSLPPMLGGRDPSGRGLSPAMGTRIPQGGYGVLPLLAVPVIAEVGLEGAALAEGTAVLGPWAGSTLVPVTLPIVEASVGFSVLTAGALTKLAYDMVSVTEAGDWRGTSPRWREITTGISKVAAKNGYSLDSNCAWMFSAEGRTFRKAQIAEATLRASRFGGGGDAVLRAVNAAWTGAQSLMGQIGAFAESGMTNALKMPNGVGVLTQAIGSAEATWYTAFAALLESEGVSHQELTTINQNIATSEAECMEGLTKFPPWTLKQFFRYLFNLKLLRTLLAKGLAKLGRLPVKIALTVLGGTVTGLIADAVKDMAFERGGVWTDLHEVVENLNAELFGVVPPGRAMWRTPDVKGHLLNRDGIVFPEGLVPPDLYQIQAQATPDGPFVALLHPKNQRPETITAKEGWVYTLYIDTLDTVGGRLKIRSAPAESPT